MGLGRSQHEGLELRGSMYCRDVLEVFQKQLMMATTTDTTFHTTSVQGNIITGTQSQATDTFFQKL